MYSDPCAAVDGHPEVTRRPGVADLGDRDVVTAFLLDRPGEGDRVLLVASSAAVLDRDVYF